MESGGNGSGRTSPGQHIVLRVVLYHVIVGAALAAVWRFFPDVFSSSGGSAGAPPAFGEPPGDPAASVSMLTMAVAMGGGALMAFPVAWLYTLARQKRGYRQTMVHALIMLPPVVAGVVVLVKFSLPLAFALAGIVAAVRFRNTLEDSKDAVYIFLATALGLAAGVDLGAALVLSVGFNVLSIALWFSDFGRRPARLEGIDAERRLDRVLAIANRTGEFVARMDQEVLAAMAPEQLEALAERASRRRRRTMGMTDPTGRTRVGTVLRVRTTDVAGTRAVVEPLLESCTRRWRYHGVSRDGDGTEVLQYVVRHRPDITSASLLDTLRSQAGTRILSAELR
ncbi:MAG TPA: DUF4956 domain-containing protein [Gemmatimonadaceae bacterium]